MAYIDLYTATERCLNREGKKKTLKGNRNTKSKAV